MRIKLEEKKVNDADQRALRKEAGVRTREEDCSYIGAKKVAQGGNLPVDRYLL